MGIYKTKSPTLDGRSYYFRFKYTDALGKYKDIKSKLYKTKKEAQNEESAYRIKLNAKDDLNDNITINEVFIKYINLHKENVKVQSTEKTNNLYKHLNIIENVKINKLNFEHIEILKNKLNESNLSTSYKNKILGLLKAIIIFSKKYYNTSDKVLIYIEKYKGVNEEKKEMQFFTIDEYKRFNDVIDNFNYKVFFEILFFMGLRQGELQALTFEDIDFEKGTISISKTLTTKIKGQKWTISTPKTKTSKRVLPLPKQVLDDLKTLNNNAKKYKDYSPKWFVFGFVEPFKETAIQVNKNKYCELAQVKQIRIHDFRHSCASLLINKGASITLVSKYLGHSNINTTLQTYTHLYKSELDNIKSMLETI